MKPQLADTKVSLPVGSGEADECLFEYLHAEMVNYVHSMTSTDKVRIKMFKNDHFLPISISTARETTKIMFNSHNGLAKRWRRRSLEIGVDGLRRRLQSDRATDQRVAALQGRAGHDKIHMHRFLVQSLSKTNGQSKNQSSRHLRSSGLRFPASLQARLRREQSILTGSSQTVGIHLRPLTRKSRQLGNHQ